MSNENIRVPRFVAVAALSAIIGLEGWALFNTVELKGDVREIKAKLDAHMGIKTAGTQNAPPSIISIAAAPVAITNSILTSP